MYLFLDEAFSLNELLWIIPTSLCKINKSNFVRYSEEQDIAIDFSSSNDCICHLVNRICFGENENVLHGIRLITQTALFLFLNPCLQGIERCIERRY